MFEHRSRSRGLSGLLALAVSACLAVASRAYERCDYMLDALASRARFAFAFAVELFAGLAPARADELAPLERVKLTASESRSLAVAKRERPLIFAGWRMSPST